MILRVGDDSGIEVECEDIGDIQPEDIENGLHKESKCDGKWDNERHDGNSIN